MHIRTPTDITKDRVLAEVRGVGSGPPALCVPKRAQRHDRAWVFDLLCSMDRAFDGMAGAGNVGPGSYAQWVRTKLRGPPLQLDSVVSSTFEGPCVCSTIWQSEVAGTGAANSIDRQHGGAADALATKTYTPRRCPVPHGPVYRLTAKKLGEGFPGTLSNVRWGWLGLYIHGPKAAHPHPPRHREGQVHSMGRLA